MMIAGLQHFSCSKGLAPTGAENASLNAISRGFDGRGEGLIQRILSGERILVPPYWSRTERLTAEAKAGSECLFSQFKHCRKTAVSKAMEKRASTKKE